MSLTDPLLHRYIQRHRLFIEEQPEAAMEAVARFSELHKKSERWWSTLVLASIVSACLTLAHLLGIKLTAEIYGQRISEIPEQAFLMAAITGFLYLFAVINGLNSILYQSLIRWTFRENLGSDYDLIYKSYLGVQIFSEIPSVFKIVTAEQGERTAVFLLQFLWLIFILIAIAVMAFPIGVMCYFCYQVANSTTSLASFEWWFIAVLTSIDFLLFAVGATARLLSQEKARQDYGDSAPQLR